MEELYEKVEEDLRRFYGYDNVWSTPSADLFMRAVFEIDDDFETWPAEPRSIREYITGIRDRYGDKAIESEVVKRRLKNG